jgi:hypothetical protein
VFRQVVARALAGIQLTSSDRNAARDLLLRAREEGQTVLADVGLTALEPPEGDARPVDIPASLRDAQQDVIDADPFLLNFLAEAVRPSYATQRYQQIAVQALLACHDTRQPAPEGLLDELARHARGGLAPDPRYVLKALITALADRGVADPVTPAIRLLPGVELSV